MPLLQRKWRGMDNRRSPKFCPQAGQSLVETVIVGAFVLVPLFIITPLLGKYINMQDSTLQAARNAAFERTVWSRHGQRNGEAVAQESDSAIEGKNVVRYFGQQNTALSSASAGAGQYAPRVLWSDQAGQPLLPKYSDVTVSLSQGSNSGAPNEALNTTLSGLGILTTGGGPNLDYRGLFTAAAQATPVNVSFPKPFNALNLTFSAQDTLLANGWSALNPQDVLTQTTNSLPKGEPQLRTFMDGEKSVVPDIQQLHLEKVLTDNAQEIPADRLGSTAP